MHTLYKLVFASGKAYIGQTIRAMNVRIAQHRQSARNGSLLPVHCAWRKHGEPVVSVVAEFETQTELHAAEKASIIAVGTLAPHGYNVSYGGDTAPSTNPDVAAKIAEKAKGRKYADTTAWSNALNLRWESAEYRQKVSDGLKAIWTDERKAARSDQSKKIWAERKAGGWKMPESTKQKLAQKVVTEETKAKMSASAKARKREPFTEETRQKMSENMKRVWAERRTRKLEQEQCR
jgi:hypothetical protein